MENSAFGERIASLRAERGETQQDLADALDVRRETVKFWESGDRQIKAADIVKLAKHFEVSADYILGLSEAMSTDLDVQAVSQYTGLNEASLDTLAKIKANPFVAKTLNRLMSMNLDRESFGEVIRYSAAACDLSSRWARKLKLLDESNPDWPTLIYLYDEAASFRFHAIDTFTSLIDEVSGYQRTRDTWKRIAKAHDIPREINEANRRKASE